MARSSWRRATSRSPPRSRCSWPSSAVSLTRACGPPSRRPASAAAERRRWCAASRTFRATRTASSSSRAPQADAEHRWTTAMILALSATLIVIVALLWEVAAPRVAETYQRHKARRARVPVDVYDPGRERRAEQRARQLLRSCVNDEEWDMYRELGFIRVWGNLSAGPEQGGTQATRAGAPYAYLIYPHKPIVAYLPQTRELLAEYCVAFPDETRPYGSARLPDSDDALAKWMALTGDERHLVGQANMHLPGRQVDPKQVRRDLWRLTQWEQARLRRLAREQRTTTS